MEPCWRKYVTGGGLWGFIAPPHFLLSLCFLCAIETRSLSFLLLPPISHHYRLNPWNHRSKYSETQVCRCKYGVDEIAAQAHALKHLGSSWWRYFMETLGVDLRLVEAQVIRAGLCRLLHTAFWPAFLLPHPPRYEESKPYAPATMNVPTPSRLDGLRPWAQIILFP